MTTFRSYRPCNPPSVQGDDRLSRVGPALDTDVIRIACWNVERNGLPGHTGGHGRRRHLP